jgi:hypothetical protein
MAVKVASHDQKKSVQTKSGNFFSMTQSLQLGFQFFDGLSNFSHLLFVFCFARFWLMGQQSFPTFWAATPAWVLGN